MSAKSTQKSLVEFRFTHNWDDEIVPVERYFTAEESKEAINMFAYTCSKTGRKPILQEIAQWERWGKSWVSVPIPEREEYTLSEDALRDTSEQKSTEDTNDSTEKAFEAF